MGEACASEVPRSAGGVGGGGGTWRLAMGGKAGVVTGKLPRENTKVPGGAGLRELRGKGSQFYVAGYAAGTKRASRAS